MHIWLLHWLFLDAINADAQDWAQGWSLHPLKVRGERRRSPYDRFIFGTIEHGPCGISNFLAAEDKDDEDVDDLEAYGVDWEVHNNAALMAHLLERCKEEEGATILSRDDNSMGGVTQQSRGWPVRMANVPCKPPNNPFSEVQIHILLERLTQVTDVYSREILVRRQVWIAALRIINELVD